MAILDNKKINDHVAVLHSYASRLREYRLARRRSIFELASELELPLKALTDIEQLNAMHEEAPTADLSEQLMNRDNCLFNRISVVILQGKVSPRNMQTVEFASLKKIDPRTLNVAYPGAYKPPLLLQIKRTNGRYLGYVETVKGPITLLECD